jgi:hypothetical protein
VYVLYRLGRVAPSREILDLLYLFSRHAYTGWYGMGWDGMVWYGMVWVRMGWNGMEWNGVGWKCIAGQWPEWRLVSRC